ncbi:Trypsin-1 [Trichoplax sp. H2]|nr:Trypsin-1 [Trichoplax sp. H2]|eukprot:RDD36299.1 Trypsin-1 [Trichoplax sp. H2]
MWIENLKSDVMKILVVIALFACATAFRLPPAYKQVPRPVAWHMEPRLEDNEDKIVGGQNSAPGEFPFIVSLRKKSGKYTYHFCGGSIISSSTVLTAAHCTVGTQANKVTVIAGEHDIVASDGTEQSVLASKLIEHPSYSSRTLDNDFSIIRLSNSFTYNANVKAVPLQMQDDIGVSKVTAIGWGALSEGGSSPRILQDVTVTVVSNSDCNAAYSGGITDNMLCAGEPSGGKDSCQGDSGGPLISGSGSSPTLVGVVSWGQGCARPGYPGVYARVSRAHSWIKQEM